MNAYMLSSKTPKQNRVLLGIVTVVLLIHVTLLLLLSTQTNPRPIPKSIERLVVKTISLNEQRISPQPQSSPAPALIVEAPPPPKPVIEVAPEIIPKEPLPPPPKEEAPKIEAPKVEAPKVAPTTPASSPEKPVEKIPEKKPAALKSKPETAPEVKKAPKPKAPENKKKTEVVKPKKEPQKAAKPPTSKPVAENKPKPKPKEVTKPQPEKKAEPPKPKVDPAVEAAKAKRRELLSNAQKSIAKIDHVYDKLAAETANTVAGVIPAKIDTLQVETLAIESANSLSPQEKSYYDELASRLKLVLRLPEFGEVRIKLTLDRSGKFVKVVIMSAESVKNSTYIEKTLPTLTYPSFGTNFSDQPQYTFIIALSNEM